MNKKNDSSQTKDETPKGIFNYAISYRNAAQILTSQWNIKINGHHAPIYFLYTHSIELLLKSFFRKNGSSMDDLKKMSHDFGKMTEKAKSQGLDLHDEDEDVLNVLATRNTNGFDFRYIKTGPFTRPTLEALERTYKNLEEQIGNFLEIK